MNKRSSFFIGVSLGLLLVACGGTIGGNPEKNGIKGDTGSVGGSTGGTPGGNPGGNPAMGTGNGKPVLRFDLTDAPVDDAKHVYVTFAEVSVKPDQGEWITLPLKVDKEIDLLTLQNGESSSLAAIDALPVGLYKETRVSLSAEHPARLIDASGEEYELKIPTGGDSGVRMKREFTVNETSELHFTIDFDLRKSIKKVGSGKDKYQLSPVLRLISDDEKGIIKGLRAAELVCFYAKGESPDSDDECDKAESSARLFFGFYRQEMAPGEYTLRFYKNGKPQGEDVVVNLKPGETKTLSEPIFKKKDD